MLRDACPACASTRTRELVYVSYSAPELRAYLSGYYGIGDEEFRRLAGQSYRVLECRDCSLCFQWFAPDADLSSRIYDHWIDPVKTRRSDLNRSSIAAYAPLVQDVYGLVRNFERRGMAPHQIRALDFGMGWGAWLRIARSLGVDACGFEVSPLRIEAAKESGLPVVSSLEGRFHIINADQVLEHVAEPADTLRQLLNCLAPHGVIKIAVPNSRGIARLVRKHGVSSLSDRRMNPIAPLEHLNAFTPRALRTMCARYGLQPVKRPFRLQAELIWAHPKTLPATLGRPIVRGMLGLGTSLIMRRQAPS